MTEKSFDLDDPRLTAYVLGELDEQEHLDVERWLADSEAASTQVAELRSLTETVFAALQSNLSEKPATSVPTTIAAGVESALAAGSSLSVMSRANTSDKRPTRHSIRFAVLASVGALMLVATVALRVDSSRKPSIAMAVTMAEPANRQVPTAGNTREYFKFDGRVDLSPNDDGAKLLHEILASDAGNGLVLEEPDPSPPGLQLLEQSSSKASGATRQFPMYAPYDTSGRGVQTMTSTSQPQATYRNAGLKNDSQTSNTSVRNTSTPAWSLQSRDTWPAKTVVGQSSPTQFSPNLDVPFRQSSFDLSAPQISGFPASAKSPSGSGDSANPAAPTSAPIGNVRANVGVDRGIDLQHPDADEGLIQNVEAGRTHWFEDRSEAAHGPIFGTDSRIGGIGGGGGGFGGGRGGKVAGGPNGQSDDTILGFSFSPDVLRRGGAEHEAPKEEEIVRQQNGRFVKPGQLSRNRELRMREGYVKGFGTWDSSEAYLPIVENPFLTATDHPFSTFGIDVDTGSYSNVRRFLLGNQLPPPNAVRIEELINSFHYDLPQPQGQHPVAVTLEVGDCPWNKEHQLVRVALKAKEISAQERPAASLVFLIDSSGSMQDVNKLPLVQSALRLLVDQMDERDQIAIVTYADEARIVLDSTTAAYRDRILHAIDSLAANGSTNGAGGLKVAYDVAAARQIKIGANRVILCTDGDFNVGVSDDLGIFKLIEAQRETGIFLSVLGFGTGNLKDSKLEGMADRGNGQYSYIDRLKQAQDILVEQLTDTLFTVAKDVKLQIEFNPNRVQSYRQIGYENRVLAKEDFNNDRIDAGDMGAGHTVTALYEIIPAGTSATGDGQRRYQAAQTDSPEVASSAPHGNELLFLKLRYKQPRSNESSLIEVPLPRERQAASADMKWAGSVAMFGLLLRNSQFKGTASYDQVLQQAREAMGSRPDEQRVEFFDLVLRAGELCKRLSSAGE